MTRQWKIGITVLLIICVGIVGYFFIYYDPPVDPTADRIAFKAMTSFPGLSALFLTESVYVTNVDSPGLTKVIRQWSPLGWGLAWSPQGERIAYYDDNNGSKSLYIINVDGPSQSKLAHQGISVVHMDWSHDGSKIVFSNGVGRVYILDLTTRQATLLLDDTMKGSEPSWSPDGTRIVFRLNPYSDGPDSSIAVINMDGSDLIQLTPDNNIRSPKWSPDGNQIVFERDRNIYVMNVDGTGVRALIEGGKSYMPAWSPDGKRIVFVSNVNQKCSGSFLDAPQFCTNELRAMNADGSEVVVIRSKANERYMSPIWAPRN